MILDIITVCFRLHRLLSHKPRVQPCGMFSDVRVQHHKAIRHNIKKGIFMQVYELIFTRQKLQKAYEPHYALN